MLGAMDAADWDRRYSDTALVWGVAPNALIADILAPLPPGRALDLACGEGRHALWLAARGWDVVGVEQSGVAVARARALAAAHTPPLEGRAVFEHADLLTWGAAPGSADLVLIAFLHMPAPERARIIAASWSALAPYGRLLVVGHDARNLDHGTGGPSDPALLYTADDLQVDLAAAALRECTILRAGEHHRTAASGGRAIDAVLYAIKAG